VSFSASFQDNPKDIHNAQWQCGSVSIPGLVNEATRRITGSQTFTTPGVYLITLTVSDTCGPAPSISIVDGVTCMVVIYDPNGGFVTGGGWIQSPPGAYVPDPDLLGKATFGFVSKYAKGATFPTGQTEFQFQVANLNFHSSSYEWLIVSGARAQFKGSGTINGTGNYGFMLNAIDGQLTGGGGFDRFRIKIWDKATGAIIYDNQPNTDDSAPLNNQTIIGGGSIAIQAAKK
jgi:hypothetical protein